MKKLLAVLIALGMFLTLTACVSNDNDENPVTTGKVTETEADTTVDETEAEETDTETETEIDTETEIGESESGESESGGSAESEPAGGEEDDNKIDPTRITDIVDFSEGKAFVRYGEMTSDEYRTVYCIDKTGEILFTLEDIGLGAGISGFHNGLAAIEMAENNHRVTWLCTEEGEFIKPADVGATSFLIDPSETYLRTLTVFADGYILAENTVTDFRGSTTKMAVLNADLEIVVDYSEELYEFYESFAYCPYYNGYLYDYDSWYETFGGALDLRTGELIEDFSEFVGSVERAYLSDLWVCRDTYYMDIATGETVVDLEEYAETIYTTYEFNCGVAPILFRVDNTEFLGIILENGTFAFDPVELKGSSATVYADGGKILVLSANGNEIYAETFDASGKLGELTFELDGTFVYASVCDGVVIIADIGRDTKYMIYTPDLQPLFE